MTIWAPADIARFSREAGFRDENLVTAVAVALAASHGDDTARVLIPAAGDADWRGLWLVRASLGAALGVAELYDPRESARTVWALSAGEAGTWDWSEVYQAGEWRQWLDLATDAANGGAQYPRNAGPGRIGSLTATLRAQADVKRRIVATRDAVYHIQ